MAKKKMYIVQILVTSTHWETAEAHVVAESEEEARKLFEADPWSYDWDYWNQRESEIDSWDVEGVECDEFETERMSGNVQGETRL